VAIILLAFCKEEEIANISEEFSALRPENVFSAADAEIAVSFRCHNINRRKEGVD
jgi:hypothetical protein